MLLGKWMNQNDSGYIVLSADGSMMFGDGPSGPELKSSYRLLDPTHIEWTSPDSDTPTVREIVSLTHSQLVLTTKYYDGITHTQKISGQSYSRPVHLESNPALATFLKRIHGKWWIRDRQKYLEFAEDGSCAEGSFYGGTWHVERGRISGIPRESQFNCSSGILSLVAPNRLTRDFGMGGDVETYYLERP